MSNFTRAAWHPVEKVARAANWLDNHFGHYCYGVWFPGDDPERVFHPHEVEIPLELVLVPRDVTNQSPD